MSDRWIFKRSNHHREQIEPDKMAEVIFKQYTCSVFLIKRSRESTRLTVTLNF